MSKSLRCIIVDDDEIDRLTTVSMVKKYPQIQITGVFDHPVAALAAAKENLPDIAFFDIDMPTLSGLDLRRQLDAIPACIFITSYAEYAAESFDVAAFDFIVKPIQSARLEKTIGRLEVFFTIRDKANMLDHSLGADTIFIKDGHDQVKLSIHEIIYLEALKDYTKIVTANGNHHMLVSIGNVLKEPGFKSFVRIHKSFAVQKNKIEKIKSQEIVVQGIVLPLGRSYKESLSGLK